MTGKIDLEHRRKELGLTLEEVGKFVGVSKSTVKKWETGYIDNMKRDKIALLSQILNVSPLTILGIEPTEKEKKKGVKIPVLGRVQAGVPVDAIEEILDYEEITQEMASQGEHFGLRVNGDSMEPKFSNGDVVIVRKQPDVDTGDIAIVLVNGSDATIKKIKKRPDGIMLVPTNPMYEVMFYNNQEMEQLPVRIIGKVVELRAKF